MSLPFGIARCVSHKPYGIQAVPCRECKRFKDTEYHGGHTFMTEPPQFINGVCAIRIAPEGEKK